jgi:hypothetical protein
MLALRDKQKSRSPFEAIFQWCRDWTRGSSVFECCTEDEVEHIAKDIGVSVSELHKLASLGPEAADLLQCRMSALDLDPEEVSRTEPRTFQDLQRVCTLCDDHRRCARDLSRDSAIPAWKDYCPNAETLMALSAMPWAARAKKASFGS